MKIELDKFVESEKIYQFPKNLKENAALFLNWMSFITDKDAKEFYRLNTIRLKDKVSGTDLKWTKGIENKFYEVVHQTANPDVVINALNEVADISNTTSHKIGPDRRTLFKALNKLEEINHFLNATTYSDPEFKKEILKKSTYCLFSGDLATMKDLTSLMSNNVDTLSIKEVLNKIQIKHSRFKVVEDLNVFNLLDKNVEIKRFNHPTTKFCGAVFSVGIALGLTNTDLFISLAEDKAKGTIETLEKGIKIAKPITTNLIQNHSSLTEITNNITSAAIKIEQFGMSLIHQIPQRYQDPKVWGTVIAIGVLLYPVAKAVPKFLVKSVKAFGDGEINMQSVKNFNSKDYLKFFIKNDLIEGVIKKEEYDLNNGSSLKHIDLVAFATKKIDNPSLKVEDFKNSNGKSIVENLSLNTDEVNRLNGLTLEEIHSISQVKNVDLRDAMLRNKFTGEELLLIKKIEANQLIKGFAIPKGNFFEVHNEEDLDVSLRGFMFSGSPIRTAIISNIIKIGSKKDGDEIVPNNDYINSIPTDISVNIYAELNNFLKIDMNDENIKKNLKEKIKSEKYNNNNTKAKLESTFQSYSVDIVELSKILKDDDTVFSIVKNKTVDVLKKIRNSFMSPTPSGPPTP